jgi:hypothetical protein
VLSVEKRFGRDEPLLHVGVMVVQVPVQTRQLIALQGASIGGKTHQVKLVLGKLKTGPQG